MLLLHHHNRCKQQGKAAVEAHNVFYYLTYYGAIDLTQIKDEALRSATELQIAHFGQCPMQLFNRPHPKRGVRVLIPRHVTACLSEMEQWKQVQTKHLALCISVCVKYRVVHT